MALPILRRGGSPVRSGGQSQTSPLGRIDPWNDVEVMNRLFDNIFQSPLSLLGRGMSQAMPTPDGQVELYETGDDLLAYVYAPGLSADSFDLSVSGDILTIKAERKPLLEASEGLTSHTPWGGQATSAGTFTASYNLPVEIDTSRVEASYKDGVLQVRMPKSEATKPKQVKIAVN